MLEESTEAPARAHDLVMLDLDGVVYMSGHAVPGAPDAVARVRTAGTAVAFVTNNASGTPAQVAARLGRLGVEAGADDVVTSAQAAARILRERHGAGARVLVLGADGLYEAVTAAGLEPVPIGARDSGPPGGVAVVTGYGPQVRWGELMRAAQLVRQGVPWVACNTDGSVQTDDGPAPGHGTLVDLVSRFAGVRPTVAGKPDRPLLEETIRRVGGSRPLMVGDRLDTDIEGARAVGVRSLLVLTGVTDLRELLSARPGQRPTYLHPDLSGLHEPHPPVRSGPDHARCGGWTARVADGRLAVDGSGGRADWWRAVAVAGWQHLDRAGSVADAGGLRPPVPHDDAADG